jgi:uncharacterized lipoprotein YddW (UPF0748 family)
MASAQARQARHSAALAASAFLAGSLACQPPPELPREFRGVWVATVDNIDWPSRPGLPTDVQQRELDALLDSAHAIGLNAIVFQVRPSCDAFYASQLEPWSEWLTGRQGRAPDPPWDPLARAIDGAHARGLELHAWINPFRARHPQAKSPEAATHVLQRAPELAVRYGDHWWLDPGRARARAWSLKVILDIVQRYDVDGIHLDDYFYPYPIAGIEFPDATSYGAYRRIGGKLSRSDWRRSNVDRFVQELYEQVKRCKPWVKVGISPFGIARPGVPKGIQAGVDQYEQLGADVLLWLRNGWCDYLAPQLYWPIDQTPQSFAVLAPWWARQDNDQHRHIWPGINPGRAAEGKRPWRQGEIQQQIDLLRRTDGITGHVHFSMRVLQADRGGIAAALRERTYRTPALVPASPWLDGRPPAAPVAQLAKGADGALDLTWQPRAGIRFLAVQARCGKSWRTVAVASADAGRLRLPADATEAVAVRAVDRCGVGSGPCLLDVPR